MREHFGWDKTDTIEFMVDCVLEEATELKESIHDEENFKKEIADVLMYVYAICIDRGYNVDEIMSLKIDEVMTREY